MNLKRLIRMLVITGFCAHYTFSIAAESLENKEPKGMVKPAGMELSEGQVRKSGPISGQADHRSRAIAQWYATNDDEFSGEKPRLAEKNSGRPEHSIRVGRRQWSYDHHLSRSAITTRRVVADAAKRGGPVAYGPACGRALQARRVRRTCAECAARHLHRAFVLDQRVVARDLRVGNPDSAPRWRTSVSSGRFLSTISS